MAKDWRWRHSLAGVARVSILMRRLSLDLQMEAEALVEMETWVATMQVDSVQIVMLVALAEMGLETSLGLVLVETEATALAELEPMDLMEMEATALVEIGATALEEIKATALEET